ncbi:MAG: hypothetical protein U0V18_17560 [Anaerolineales bacterium]
MAPPSPFVEFPVNVLPDIVSTPTVPLTITPPRLLAKLLLKDEFKISPSPRFIIAPPPPGNKFRAIAWLSEKIEFFIDTSDPVLFKIAPPPFPILFVKLEFSTRRY